MIATAISLFSAPSIGLIEYLSFSFNIHFCFCKCSLQIFRLSSRHLNFFLLGFIQYFVSASKIKRKYETIHRFSLKDSDLSRVVESKENIEKDDLPWSCRTILWSLTFHWWTQAHSWTLAKGHNPFPSQGRLSYSVQLDIRATEL